MRHLITILFVAVSMCMIILNCSQSSEYQQLVDRELASGERHDSLFLGLYLGMTRKDFYTHCWTLNKKGLLTNGSKNNTAEYKTGELLPYPAIMNFYPAFIDEKIQEMPVTFTYIGWAPWNKTLSSDSLLVEVKQLMSSWYGDDWITVTHKTKPTLFVQVDGNRRVSLYRENEQDVKVIITDLSIKKTEQH